jgi:hypothetical protein
MVTIYATDPKSSTFFATKASGLYLIVTNTNNQYFRLQWLTGRNKYDQ